MPATSNTVDWFPEEILEQILTHYCHSTLHPLQWWYSHSSKVLDSDSSGQPSPRIAPLLVSRQFSKIYIPLLYGSIRFPSSDLACARLLETLAKRPELVEHVKQLTIWSVSKECVMILDMCKDVVLDFTIELSYKTPFREVIDAQFGDILTRLSHVRNLTLHTLPGVVSSSPGRSRAIIKHLSNAIRSWPELQTVFADFKMYDDEPSSVITSTSRAGPIYLFTSALAAVPTLHTFKTHFPFEVNNAILKVAENPYLQRIIFISPSSTVPFASTAAGNLLLEEASCYPRLMDLVCHGSTE